MHHLLSQSDSLSGILAAILAALAVVIALVGLRRMRKTNEKADSIQSDLLQLQEEQNHLAKEKRRIERGSLTVVPRIHNDNKGNIHVNLHVSHHGVWPVEIEKAIAVIGNDSPIELLQFSTVDRLPITFDPRKSSASLGWLYSELLKAISPHLPPLTMKFILQSCNGERFESQEFELSKES